MFEHILVPVDLTEKTTLALARVRPLAAGGKARVTLLHVIETIEDASFEELAAFYRRLESKAQSLLARWADELGREDIEARHEVAYGRRSEEILRYAGEQAVDLVVMTSHRVDPESPGRGWGTISHQVALLAPCSVLLVK